MDRGFRSPCVARGLRAGEPRLVGTLPGAGRAGTPLADALGVGGALEGVGVGRLVEPLGLARTLAGLAIVGLRSERLPSAMTGIGMEEPVAMEALGGSGDAGHRGGRRKQGWHLDWKKTPPQRHFRPAESIALGNGADR